MKNISNIQEYELYIKVQYISLMVITMHGHPLVQSLSSI